MTCVVPEMTPVMGEALIMIAMIEPIGLAGEALLSGGSCKAGYCEAGEPEGLAAGSLPFKVGSDCGS